MDTVIKAVKKTYPTHKMSWVWYIAQSLGRVAHFDDRDVGRSREIADALFTYVRRHAPSGSGIDSGTSLSERSTSKKLIFNCQFHHMNEHGTYTNWTDHMVTVTPEFQGFTVTVSGRDQNGIKNYLGELFHQWLSSDYDHPALVEYINN